MKRYCASDWEQRRDDGTEPDSCKKPDRCSLHILSLVRRIK